MRHGGHAGPVSHGDGLRVHGVHPACGAQRVGELATDLGDLPHGDERRQRQQGEERQHPTVEAAGPRQHGAGGHHGETAEAGGDLLEHGLARQILQEGQAHVHVGACASGEGDAAGALLLEGDDLHQALHGVHRMGVHLARRLAGPRAEPVDARAREHGAEGGVGEEREDGQRQRPPEPEQGGEHGSWGREWPRRPGQPCGRRSTRSARCHGWPRRPGRPSAGASGRRGRGRRAS